MAATRPLENARLLTALVANAALLFMTTHADAAQLLWGGDFEKGASSINGSKTADFAKKVEADGVEAEVGARVRDPAGQHPTGYAEAARRVGDGLVGEVEHDLGRSGLERLLEGLEDRDAVVLSPTQLLHASEEDRADNLVPDARERDADDVRVVLPID